MTTQSWSTRVRHDTDALFREWGSELNAKLAAAGLVQTSDTGQINWTTVVRAGTSADAGYEIWRMNDTQQATAPVFFRINYGTGTATTSPRISIAVGIATNGAGTVTTIGGGAATARLIHNSNTQTSDTTRQSYCCVTAGFFGLSWKTGSGTAEGAFFFARTVDSSGVADARGGMCHWGAGSTSSIIGRQAMRFAATAVLYTLNSGIADAALCINPQVPTTTSVGSDIQAMIAWTITPRVEPLIGVCGVISTELAVGGTFSATLVGVTAHTYLTNTAIFGSATKGTAGLAGELNIAMLWE